MFVLANDEFDTLRRGVRAALPREACGVLLKENVGDQTVLSLRFTSHDENTPTSFIIRNEALREIKRAVAGTPRTMCGCVHSHIFGRAWPSPRDSAGEKTPGELWLIYSLRTQSLRLFEWDGSGFQRRHVRIARRRPSHLGAIHAGCGCGDCEGCAEVARLHNPYER